MVRPADRWPLRRSKDLFRRERYGCSGLRAHRPADAVRNGHSRAEAGRTNSPPPIAEDEAHGTGEGGPESGLRLLVRHAADGHSGERDPGRDEHGRGRVTTKRRRQRSDDENGQGQTAEHGLESYLCRERLPRSPAHTGTEGVAIAAASPLPPPES